MDTMWRWWSPPHHGGGTRVNSHSATRIPWTSSRYARTNWHDLLNLPLIFLTALPYIYLILYFVITYIHFFIHDAPQLHHCSSLTGGYNAVDWKDDLTLPACRVNGRYSRRRGSYYAASFSPSHQAHTHTHSYMHTYIHTHTLTQTVSEYITVHFFIYSFQFADTSKVFVSAII